MDRLRHAAQEGNIEELYNCIREEVEVRRCINDGDDDDELINETPLHIAVMGGHVEFAKALMYLKPSWGRKLNKEMQSPMHLAVLHEDNNKELVLALLAVNKDLVRVKGKDGYTALHNAAEKGNLEVLAHFLKDCPECLEDVTIRDETALHVAAKNGKLEALQILARCIRRIELYCQVSKRHLLNCKDGNGDTVLHIAASKTEYKEMIRVLLECKADKKAINQSGLTASSLVDRQSRGTRSEEIFSDITRNGLGWGVKFDRIVSLMLCRNQISEQPLQDKLRDRITFYELVVANVTGSITNMSGDNINAVLVVLGLIFAAAYQAALNPPGGVWQGSYSEANASPTSAAGTHVGQSIMKYYYFRVFSTLNWAVFCYSSLVTVAILRIISGNNGVAVISEILLSLLWLCIILATKVIQPNGPHPRTVLEKWVANPTDLWPIQVFLIILIFVAMDRVLLNPPIVRFFRNFFRNRIQK